MRRTNFLFSVILSALLIAGNVAVVRAESLPAPLDNNSLASASGLGETSNLSIAETNSVVTGNTIGDVGYTGGISNISASNNSGLTTLIENTGNQVSISTATVVNVNFH